MDGHEYHLQLAQEELQRSHQAHNIEEAQMFIARAQVHATIALVRSLPDPQIFQDIGIEVNNVATYLSPQYRS